MPKQFLDGHHIETHAHARDQLLFCVSGVMRLLTENQSVVVPPERAILIPSGLQHSVEVHGAVEMRTLYLLPDQPRRTNSDMRVISVSALLRELIEALCEEPIDYGDGSRGDAIANLILREMDRATEIPLSIPLPKDKRLQRLCATLLADPSDARALEDWAETEGASARTLARLFEAELALGFGKWRARLRFQYAIKALSHGAPVAQVARSCGYSSPSAFSAAFRKTLGVVPSDIVKSAN